MLLWRQWQRRRWRSVWWWWQQLPSLLYSVSSSHHSLLWCCWLSVAALAAAVAVQRYLTSSTLLDEVRLQSRSVVMQNFPIANNSNWNITSLKLTRTWFKYIRVHNNNNTMASNRKCVEQFSFDLLFGKFMLGWWFYLTWIETDWNGLLCKRLCAGMGVRSCLHVYVCLFNKQP